MEGICADSKDNSQKMWAHSSYYRKVIPTFMYIHITSVKNAEFLVTLTLDRFVYVLQNYQHLKKSTLNQ